jgi:hypothetical protein
MEDIRHTLSSCLCLESHEGQHKKYRFICNFSEYTQLQKSKHILLFHPPNLETKQNMILSTTIRYTHMYLYIDYVAPSTLYC